jgi:hypothetical protein
MNTPHHHGVVPPYSAYASHEEVLLAAALTRLKQSAASGCNVAVLYTSRPRDITLQLHPALTCHAQKLIKQEHRHNTSKLYLSSELKVWGNQNCLVYMILVDTPLQLFRQ